MSTLKLKLTSLGVGVTALLIGLIARAEEIPASTSAAITAAVGDMKTSLFALLTDNLPVLFVIFACIVGITLVLKLARRIIGR